MSDTPVYNDDDFLPVSALQSFVFCRRQCALNHCEQIRAENRLTAEGRLLHQRVHEEKSGIQEGRLIARGLRLASRRLGLSGIADVVEFHPVSDASEGVSLHGRSGYWRPFPVEYKRGRPKNHNADLLQLCAQAMCLEEMLGASIEAGAMFYGATRRRLDVRFDQALRQETETCLRDVRGMLSGGVTPPPEPGPKCKHCSLKGDCLPQLPASAAAYLRRMVRQTIREE